MKSFRLIQFTDTHLFGSPAARFRGVATYPALQAAVAHANQRFAARDAILLTGDLVQDDPAGYQLVRETFGASKAPVYCVPGNHDLPDQMQTTLRGGPFHFCGAPRFGAWTVVLLDTYKAGSAGGRLGGEQLDRLSHLLQERQDSHVMLCLHHQPIAMRSRWLDGVGLEDAAELLAIIAAHANVRAVLWGHVHQPLDSFERGVHFMSTPATCAQFLPRSDTFALDLRPPGYRVLDLMPDGTVSTEIVWLENAAT
jgi:Icc protein